MSSPADPPALRVLPAYPPLPPPAGMGCGRVLLVLLLLGSLAVNVFLLCGGFLLRGVLGTETSDLGLHDRCLAGATAASDKVAVGRIDAAIMEGLLGYARKQIDQAAAGT